MRRLAAVGCLALLAVARPALCAQGPRIEPGTRIRFDAASLGLRLTGTLVAIEPATLVVALDGDAPGLAVIVPKDSVSAFAVYRERRMIAEGMLIGILAGAAVGALASPEWVDDNGDCTTVLCVAYEISEETDTRMVVLGIAGAALGAIAGSSAETTGWVKVPLHSVTFGGTPDGGVAVGVRLSF
jgi:hypothetical protein